MRTYGRKSKPAATLRAIGESLEKRELLTVLVPSDLQTGDKYHLAFVSSQPIAGDFGTQVFPDNGLVAGDAFVSALAAAPGTVTMNGTYQAIISDSVQGVNALSRVSTNFPIYNTNGNRVANDYAGLFGGVFMGLDAPIAYDEYGTPKETFVWTGTDSNGAQSTLGDNGGWTGGGFGGVPGGGLEQAAYGESSDTGFKWIESWAGDPMSQFSLYGVSPTYEVCGDGTASLEGDCSVVTPPDPGQITGRKWHDLDADRMFDGNEMGLNGWTIELVNSSGSVQASDVTHDVNGQPGHYQFNNVPPGSYTVREVQQNGWQQSAPAQPYQVTITDGDIYSGRDFGNYQFGSLTGRVCEDVNEIVCVANWPVELTGVDGLGNTVFETTTTSSDNPDTMEDETGTFSFGPVVPGGYVVTVVTPPGVVVSSTNATVSSGGTTGTMMTVTARYPTITGTKFDDINGDGIQQSWEPGLAGWTIYIDQDGSGTLSAGDFSVVTDTDGSYDFPPLPTGTPLTVREVQQAGWVQTTTDPAPITLTTDQVVSGVDFGNFELIDIVGSKFKDSNQNGAWDAGEVGLEGWTIYLDLNNDGQLAHGEPLDVTDANGYYEFTDLGPGEYVVRELMQDGWNATHGANGHVIQAMSGVDPSSGNCSGGKPLFDDPAFADFSGQIAAVTCYVPQVAYNAAGSPVMALYHLDDLDPAYIGQSTPHGSASGQIRKYTGPGNAWSREQLGDIYGITFDDLGNIYVTATSVYGYQGVSSDVFEPHFGVVGGSSAAGAVYKIDRRSGLPSLFASLPNSDTGLSTPSLGNITFDKDTETFFVSNFEDGRIYQLDRAGNVLEAYDHITSTTTSFAVPNPTDISESGDTSGEAVPLGELTWGLATHQGRLYYSVWSQNQRVWPTPQYCADAGINGVFSIDIGANGFGTPRFEVDVLPGLLPMSPPSPGPLPCAPGSSYTNPVSDISFGPSGKMLVGERTMDTSPETNHAFPLNSGAHSSRVIEFESKVSSWVQTNEFGIGTNGGSYAALNAAGGVDYDHHPGGPADSPAGRVWATGDALKRGTGPGGSLGGYPNPDPGNTGTQMIYGFQGLPSTGGNYTNSYLVDLDGEIFEQGDKSEQGDIEIPCRPGVNFGNYPTGIHGQKFHYATQEQTSLLGDNDSFSYSAPEPTTPSPNLSNYLNAFTPRGYDEPGEDKFWGDSFTNLPSDVTRISVVVHAKPDNTTDLTYDDTISFGAMGPNSMWEVDNTTGSSLATQFHLGAGNAWTDAYAPNQSSGAAWNVADFPNGQLQRYSFNSGSPVVEAINNHGRMDVIVQDDTIVDYIEICYVYRTREGLNGWTITADDGTSSVSQVTHEMDLDNDGIIDPETERGLYWLEGLDAGTYTVSESMKAFWRPVDPVTGSQTVSLASGQVLQGVDFENMQYIERTTCVQHTFPRPSEPAIDPQYELTFDGLSGPLASDQFLASHGVTLSGLGAGPAAGVFAAYADTQPSPAISNLLGYDGTYQPAGDEVLYVPQGVEPFMIEFDEPINSLSAFVATVDTAASDDGFWIRVYSASGEMEDTFIFGPDEGDGNPAVSQLAYHFRDAPVSKVAIWNATGDIIVDEIIWSTAAAQQAELLSQAQDHTDFFDDLPGTTIQFDFADPNVELVPREGYTGEYVLRAQDIPGVDVVVRKKPKGKVSISPEGGELGELDGYDGTLAPDGSNAIWVDFGDVIILDDDGEIIVADGVTVPTPVPDVPNANDHEAWIELDFAQGITAIGGFAAIPGVFSFTDDNGKFDWPFIVAVFGPDGGELDVEPFFGGQAYSDPDNSEFHWRIAAPEGEEIGSVRFYSIDSNGAPDFDAQLLLGNLTIQDTGVVGRHIFYNESGFDDNDAAATAADDGAIASDKFALEPGEIANFAHYTSYSKGINGIMVDLARTGDAEITAEDFEFKVGNSDSPSDWITAPSPDDIVVRPGEGVGESDRVTIIWANNEIEKQWLEVTILANDNTELDSPDVHYWGNAIGETGNDAASAFVNTSDVLDARANPHNIFNRAEIDDRYDFNRDSFVNTADVLVSRENGSNIFNRLKLIDLSMPSSAAARSSAVDTVFAKPTAEEPSFDFDDFLALATNFGTGELGDLANDETVSFNEFLLIAAALKKSI